MIIEFTASARVHFSIRVWNEHGGWEIIQYILGKDNDVQIGRLWGVQDPQVIIQIFQQLLIGIGVEGGCEFDDAGFVRRVTWRASTINR